MRMVAVYCRHCDAACARAWLVPEGIDTPVLPPMKLKAARIAMRRMKGHTGLRFGACVRPAGRGFGRWKRTID